MSSLQMLKEQIGYISDSGFQFVKDFHIWKSNAFAKKSSFL